MVLSSSVDKAVRELREMRKVIADLNARQELLIKEMDAKAGLAFSMDPKQAASSWARTLGKNPRSTICTCSTQAHSFTG